MMKHYVPVLLLSAFGTFCLSPALAQSGRPPAQATQVFAAEVQPRMVADKIEALGTLRANETVTLTANVQDIVTAIRFEDGQRVNAGDILVEMANAEETAILKEAQANVSEAQRQVRRLEPLVKQGAVSKSALDSQNRAYESAKAQLDAVSSRLQDRLIIAPFDGIVGLRNISLGTLLQPGAAITTLDDDSVMKLDFSVPSVFLSSLEQGMPIEARTRAYPERIFTGTIQSIATQIDPVSRAITVRAVLPNDEKILKPGLLMTVSLNKGEREAITISELALIVEGADHFVYVIDGDTARRRKVSIGTRAPGYVEVTDGLKPGERIVNDGVMKLSDGSKVTVRAVRGDDDTLRDLLKQEPPAPAAGNAE